MSYDSPAFYSEEELLKWYWDFQRPEYLDRITLPGIPFSFYEIQRELIRRQNERETLEDLGK